MINTIAMGLGVFWLGYKWIVTRKTNYIFSVIVLIVVQLASWPFFLNQSLVFGLFCLFNAIILSVKFYIKKQIMVVYPYIIVFFSVGVWLLSRFFLGKD
jgi:hypothetical protein